MGEIVVFVFSVLLLSVVRVSSLQYSAALSQDVQLSWQVDTTNNVLLVTLEVSECCAYMIMLC